MYEWVHKAVTGFPGDGPAKTQALDSLFRAYKPALMRFALARLRQEEDAEEIVHEAFLRFQTRYDPATIDAPEALLARIVANLVIDRVRERNARAAREDAWGQLNIPGASTDLSSQSAPTPARVLQARQSADAAHKVLEALPEKTRHIFLLHRFEGLSHGEIVDRTGIPKSTVEKHMIRAIKALSTLRES